MAGRLKPLLASKNRRECNPQNLVISTGVSFLLGAVIMVALDYGPPSAASNVLHGQGTKVQSVVQDDT